MTGRNLKCGMYSFLLGTILFSNITILLFEILKTRSFFLLKRTSLTVAASAISMIAITLNKMGCLTWILAPIRTIFDILSLLVNIDLFFRLNDTLSNWFALRIYSLYYPYILCFHLLLIVFRIKDLTQLGVNVWVCEVLRFLCWWVQSMINIIVSIKQLFWTNKLIPLIVKEKSFIFWKKSIEHVLSPL